MMVYGKVPVAPRDGNIRGRECECSEAAGSTEGKQARLGTDLDFGRTGYLEASSQAGRAPPSSQLRPGSTQWAKNY